MRRLKLSFFLFLVCGLLACSKEQAVEDVEEEQGTRKAAPKYQALAERFGQAFIDKDYRAIHDLMSPDFRSQVSLMQMEEELRPYRNAFEGTVTAGYDASEDPMAEFVAESERKYLVEEITIEFAGTIEGEEGAFFCTVWIIDNGTPSIAHFYLED